MGDKWMQCEQKNITYMNCPVAWVANKSDEFEMSVAAHNPASLNKHHFHMLVPAGNYTVEKFDDVSGDFKSVTSSLSCKTVEIEYNHDIVEDSCSLHVSNTTLEAKSVSLFRVKRASKELSTNQVE